MAIKIGLISSISEDWNHLIQWYFDHIHKNNI